MTAESSPLIFAAGLQSSGSTLVSWCFLQRGDCDGVLDGDTDLVPRPRPAAAGCNWYKTTISCFDLEELLALLADEGWQVRPLLIVRDVRYAWVSLSGKHYGRNGITAEDPPLRLRFLRFLRSWRYAQARGIPVLKFEQFLEQPEASLEALCRDLGLRWDPAMIDWPKPASEIGDTRHGNATFRAASKASLKAAIASGSASTVLGEIHQQDLVWLESRFQAYNEALGYPLHVSPVRVLSGCLQPDWSQSRRWKWRLQQRPWRYLLYKMGLRGYSPRPE